MSGEKGMLTYERGYVYEGFFEAGQLRRGTAKYPNDNGVYEGEFLKWRLHGRGKYISTKGRTERDGLWENGQPVSEVRPEVRSEVLKCIRGKGAQFVDGNVHGGDKDIIDGLWGNRQPIPEVGPKVKKCSIM